MKCSYLLAYAPQNDAATPAILEAGATQYLL